MKRPVEERAEVFSLEGLHAERRKLLVHLAPLKALHCHNGLYDDKRKNMVEAMKVKARMAIITAGGKPTDASVEAAAYSDEQYEAFLDQGVTDRIAYIHQQNELDEITEQIKSREIELLVFNSEVKLAK
jgi:hypothetical protein